MSVAKFVAANGREALRQVREAMGPDAVVLSNRTVEGGVEIVAMRDTDLGAINESAERYLPPPPPVVQAVPEAGLGDLRGELQSMRALIERQLAIANPAAGAHSVPTGGDPLRESLFEWMVGAGFSGQLSRTLISRLPVGHDRPAAMAWIRHELAAKLPVLGNDDALFAKGGVLALIGPTGVGKTTTTAKLAARFVLKHGPEKLALLTTDSFRIGAHEQLRIYGDILGVPVHAVKDATDLRFALDALADKHLVIVDTVGMSQRDRSVSDQIAMLAGVQTPMQRVLLLNGTSHGDTLNEVVHAYRHDVDGKNGGGLDGCIISKLDEATHLGSVLDIVIRHRLPVYYASTGQRVPEHLELAQGEALIERAFLTPRRGSVFADAQVARIGVAGHDEESARGGADDVLRSISDSASAVGDCVNVLSDGPYGFELMRTLWEARDGDAPSRHAMARLVRDALAADVEQHADKYVLAMNATISVPAPGRRSPQAWLHTLWASDRDGLPLAAAASLLARGGKQLVEDESDALGQVVAGARKVVRIHDSFPTLRELERARDAGEHWLAPARKTTRVAVGGKSRKLDELAQTLTFQTLGDTRVRGRDVTHWVSSAMVRVLDSQLRGVRAPASEAGDETGLEAGLLVSRLIDSENGQTVAIDYLLCDPVLAGEGVHVARWALWANAAQAQCRTLRHAVDQFGILDADADPEARACANLAALQAGMTALRLEAVPATGATDFLVRLAGKPVRGAAATPAAPVLVEGLGRLIALLEVLENYPGRRPRVALNVATAPVVAPFAPVSPVAAPVGEPLADAAEAVATPVTAVTTMMAAVQPTAAQHLAERMAENLAQQRGDVAAHAGPAAPATMLAQLAALGG